MTYKQHHASCWMFAEQKRDPFGSNSKTPPHQETVGEIHICCQILKGIPSRFIVTHIFLSLTKFSKTYASAL